jgi:hypothetical protein
MRRRGVGSEWSLAVFFPPLSRATLEKSELIIKMDDASQTEPATISVRARIEPSAL